MDKQEKEAATPRERRRDVTRIARDMLALFRLRARDDPCGTLPHVPNKVPQKNLRHSRDCAVPQRGRRTIAFRIGQSRQGDRSHRLLSNIAEALACLAIYRS